MSTTASFDRESGCIQIPRIQWNIGGFRERYLGLYIQHRPS